MPRLPEQAEVPVIKEVPPIASPPVQAPTAVTPEKPRKVHGRLPSPKQQPLRPDIQPINVRRARFADSEDKEMPEAQSKERASEGSRHSEASSAKVDKGALRPDGTIVSKSLGRQSELTGTVD
jgi:hypothetical protein